jgi:hypothetical protein
MESTQKSSEHDKQGKAMQFFREKTKKRGGSKNIRKKRGKIAARGRNVPRREGYLPGKARVTPGHYGRASACQNRQNTGQIA